jgi:hypothetical protein
MDSKNFANYLTTHITEKLKTWEASILNGSFKSIEEYQNAIGTSKAFASVIEGIPFLHKEFIKKQDDGNTNLFSSGENV